MLMILTKILKFLIIYKLIFNKAQIKAQENSVDIKAPTCYGKHQIYPEESIIDFPVLQEESEPIEYFDFDQIPLETTLANKGYYVAIYLKFNGTVPTINVNLNNSFKVEATFRLEFLYFNFFKEASSMYSYENVTFPVEFNAVFADIRSEDFSSAAVMKRGLTILSFPIDLNPYKPLSFDVLQGRVKLIEEAYSIGQITNKDLNYWISDNKRDFFVYEGSFLQWNCRGKVLWIDMINSVSISKELVKEFQKLKYNNTWPLMMSFIDNVPPKGPIYANIREKQPLGAAPPFSFSDLEENAEVEGFQMGAGSTIVSTQKLLGFSILFVVILDN